MNDANGDQTMDLGDVDVLSFDVYGTLIDWEAGIAQVLSVWAAEVGSDLSREDLLVAYSGHEAAVEAEQPTALYPVVLAEAFRRTGTQLGHEVTDGWADRLAVSVPDWPAFDDSVAALSALAEHFTLVVLSNVDRASFTGSDLRLGQPFQHVITAEDVGAYKPAEPHFRALDGLLVDLGVNRSRHLHVAQSLFHDHVPARREGLKSVWINRRHDRPGWGATPEPSGTWSFDAEFPSMKAFAAAAVADKADKGAPA